MQKITVVFVSKLGFLDLTKPVNVVDKSGLKFLYLHKKKFLEV